MRGSSHCQKVPHTGRPHIIPPQIAKAVKTAPISAPATATASNRRSRFQSQPMPASAVTPPDR